MTAPLCFLDTETTGLGPDRHIWEIAAILRNPDGTETEYHAFVQHDQDRAASLPESFRTDHDARYVEGRALTPAGVVDDLTILLRTDGGYHDRPHIVGAVPSFDTQILEMLFGYHGHKIPWHHHIQDAETLSLGYVAALAREYPGSRFADYMKAGAPPVDSDKLSALIGVEPAQFERHTAMGDVRWSRAMWDTVMAR